MNGLNDDPYTDSHGDPFDDDTDQTLILAPEAETVATDSAVVDSTAQSDSTDPAAPSLYEMVLQVGEGAMGEVFLARDKNLLRRVAYKRLHTRSKIDAEALVRFVREVQITAQLEHPNVIPVYHLEQTDTGWAYSMKLVFGKTLKELIAEARAARDAGREVPSHCQQRTLLEHFVNVCDAMDYAHAYGVIHRDLKPANIMVGPHREVYVMDWGIARLMQDLVDLPPEEHPQYEVLLEDLPGLMEMAEGAFDETQTGKILGTPRYLSPEQATGQNHRLDGRSDQFTLGLILQEIVTLTPAYQAKTMPDLLQKVLKTERRPLVPYTGAPKIPRELRAIIARATQRKRAHRYANVKALATDLRHYLRGEAVKTQPDNLLQATFRWMKKHQLITATAVLCIFFVLSLMATRTLYAQTQQRQRLQREQLRLSQLQSAASHRAHQINNYFLQVESRLKVLSATLESHLSGNRSPTALYEEADYLRSPPPGMVYAPRYSKLINFDHAVIKKLDSGPTPQALTALGQMVPTLKQMFADETLTWAHILLPGVYLSYPGKSGYPLDYQPKQQIWARTPAKPGIPRWSSPYVDIQGQGIMLAVTTRFEGGLAALTLQPRYLINRLMQLKNFAGHQSYLLNAEGEIMVDARDAARMSGMRYGNPQSASVIETPLFDVPELVSAVQQKKSGYQRHMINARPTLFVFYPLDSLGWYYVAELDEETLFK